MTVFASSLKLGLAISAIALLLNSCAINSGPYFGKTTPPAENVLRYVSGPEPESLDPALVTGQPEARIMLAIYEGLVEYHPKTMQPIPALAKSWDISPDGTVYTFHLRDNARFSNGEPIKSKDIVYSIRRGLDPKLASRNAGQAYKILNAQAYNSESCFLKMSDGNFQLKDAKSEEGRLTVPCDEKQREDLIQKEPSLEAKVSGRELVPVTPEDVGVEALDEYTVRITLEQRLPYFLGLLAHQFFRVVHKETIEKFGSKWTDSKHIVTSGPFKLVSHRPYDELIVIKDGNYWDAINVQLERIEFYPSEESTTILNLYKAGWIDATFNHSVPAPWKGMIAQYTAEYSLHPEVANVYYSLSFKKPPMDNENVRRALSMAINRDALAKFRKTSKPLSAFVPQGVFAEYDEVRHRVFNETLHQRGESMDEWSPGRFDPEAARALMKKAGYPVQDQGGGFTCPSFPADKISITYNTAEANQKTAEFIQAQWMQNLGIYVTLRNMESKTFLSHRAAVEYNGAVFSAWGGDYMDAFTFIGLFYAENNNSATGWHETEFDKKLDDANRETSQDKRYEMLAAAEFEILDKRVTIPLLVPDTSWMKKVYVKGMYPNPGTLHAWKFVYIERDESRWTKDMEHILDESDPIVEAHLQSLAN